MKHVIDFVLYYFLFPYSMMIFVGFTSFMMRDLINTWLKERREENAEKDGGEGK